jgi:hypothetical protein
VQEKLGRYLSLLEQVRELEQDPDLVSFLAGDRDGASAQVPGKSRKRTPSSKRKGMLLLQELKNIGISGGFEPADAVAMLDLESEEETVKGLSAKQANGILRHLAAAGLVFVVEPGKRGKAGRMPRYALIEDQEEEVNEKTG